MSELHDPRHERLAEVGGMLCQSLDILRGEDDIKAIIVLRHGIAGGIYVAGYADEEVGEATMDMAQAMREMANATGGAVVVMPLSQN